MSMTLHWFEPVLLILASITIVRSQIARFLITLLLSQRRKAERQSIQNQITEYRKELKKISQVDEFAKYSKVERKLRASSDQLGVINRQNQELQLKYVVIVQVLACLVALSLGSRLVYQILATMASYVGFL